MKTVSFPKRFRLPLTLFLGVLALANSGQPAARGADRTWVGGTSNNFNDGANWTPSTPTIAPPGGTRGVNGDTATFITGGANPPNDLYFTSNLYYLGSFTFGTANNTGANNATVPTFTFQGPNSTGTTPDFELRLNTGGAITINAGVSTPQTFKTKIGFTPGTYTFVNNGDANATLNFTKQIRSTNTSGATSTLTLAGANTSANTISGNLVNGNGAGLILNKEGAGTWVLSGTNTYTGATSVNAGTLLVNGINSGTGTVTVTNSGTILGGTGTIGGAVTVNTGAAIQGGSGLTSTGTLTLSNNLTLNSGSIIELALGAGGGALHLGAHGRRRLDV